MAVVTAQLARDLIDALGRLRLARTLDPKHDGEHSGCCDVCVSQNRLDWLMDRI
jgi:hypothetical protein